jgi:tetrahedral aminopeptidase
MKAEAKEFLFDLLRAPGPSGFEQPIQRVVRKWMEPVADLIEIDLHGNVIVALNPDAERRVMLAGHCDQIGFMVKHITEKGFIYVTPVGGIDAGVLPGSHVTIHGSKKGEVSGVFGRKPIHMQEQAERQKMNLDINKLWIDIGAKDKKEAEQYVEIGDPITFALGVTELRNDLICSPGVDDRSGLFVAMETLRRCAGKKLNVGLYAVSTVQEEIGLRGARTAAYGIDPEVGIAIDVCHASDDPSNDDSKAIDCLLGKGPAITCGPNTNPEVRKALLAAAKKAKVSFQTSPVSRPLGNDANAMQVSRAGVATASIGIPNRYMHTQVEMCSLKDLDQSAALLAAFVQSITSKTSFIPE